MSVKISIVGAGSAVFSINLVKDICLTKNLKNATVSLMDIDKTRLNDVYKLIQRYIKEVGGKLHIEKTLSRTHCLKGADFVINVALEGSHRFKQGFALAKKHGYRFGGSMHVMHDEAFWINFYQYGLMESILKDMLRICPKAWYLLVANPVLGGVTYLQRKYPGAKIVGMCHGAGGWHSLASALGLNPKHVTWEVSGVNHFIWLTRFLHKGKNAYPLLDKWLKKKAKIFWKKSGTSNFAGPKPCDLYKRFGVFPIGDTANPGGGAWPFWYHTDRATENKWQEDPDAWWAGYFTNCARKMQELNQLVRDTTIKMTDRFPPRFSGEPMIPFIEAIACNVKKHLVLNILNKGSYIPAIAKDFEVELHCMVDGKGIHPKKVTQLPAPVMAYLKRDRVAPVEMELRAFQEKRFDYLLSLVMMDPWTKSEKQARGLIKAIFALPYHKELRRHYK